MNVYISSRFDRVEEVRDLARDLQEKGFYVCSTWHRENVQHEFTSPAGENVGWEEFKYARALAEDDIYDIESCAIFITLTEGPSTGYTKGGRHVELGFAIASGKRVFILGPRESVFHYLREVSVFYDKGAMLRAVEEYRDSCTIRGQVVPVVREDVHFSEAELRPLYGEFAPEPQGAGFFSWVQGPESVHCSCALEGVFCNPPSAANPAKNASCRWADIC